MTAKPVDPDLHDAEAPDARADAVAIGPSTLRLERRLPGPIERVWSYLVDDELRARWLAGGPMEGRVGGGVTLRFRHADLSPETEEVPERYRATAEAGHEMHGTVTAWEPPHRLRYTWDDADEGSEVEFLLRAEGESVVLTLTHRRLGGRRAMISVSGGWDTHVDILRRHLAGERIPPFWGAHARVEARYAERLAEVPERVRPEGAPVLLAADDGRALLRFVRVLGAGVEEAWRAVTEPAGLDAWYPAELRFEARVGGTVRERFPGSDVTLPEGRVAVWEPPRRFAYELEADPSSSEPSVRHPQRIDLRLEPGGGGCTLTFEHAFGDRAMAADLAAGWHACLDALGAVAAGRPPEAADHEALRAAYAPWFGDGTG